MPTYEYICEKCGVFEEFHGINASCTNCPTCGSPVRRLISQNSNIIFKGSGFYTTDHRSGDYSKKVTSDTGSSASTPSKSESKAS